MTQMAQTTPLAAMAPTGRRWDPWPLGIAAFLVLFVGGVVTFIVFAVHQQMDLVRADYYEEEIRYQLQFDRLNRTRALGAAAGMEADLATGRLQVRIPPGHAAAHPKGSIQLYRPSDAASDRAVEFGPSDSGIQVVSLAGLRPGLWRAKVRWTADALEYHMEEEMIIPGGN